MSDTLTHFAQDYTNQTVIHPVGLLMVLVLGMATFVVQRKYAFVPILILACFIPSAQRISIAGLDFHFIRVMLLFGWLRIYAYKEYIHFRWKTIDYIILMWGAALTIISILRYFNTSLLFSMIINKMGVMYDLVGMYFMFRFWIRDWDDIKRAGIALAMISLPVAITFLYEKLTGYNVFSIFGGVPEHTQIREGKLRAQGAFAHPILAGVFWASILPIVASFWWHRKLRTYAVLGIFGCLFIIVGSASSTPVMGVAAAIFGGMMYTFKKDIGKLLLFTIGLLFILHFVREGPVWGLIGHLSGIGASGSTGWHRAELIDAAVIHLNEWWILGINYTGHWGPGKQDITNQYIFYGVQGGLITLIFFVLILYFAFKSVGQFFRTAKTNIEKAMSWALGVSLFVHAVSFIGVSYFGQITVIWYFLLAAIGSMAPVLKSTKRKIVDYMYKIKY